MGPVLGLPQAQPVNMDTLLNGFDLPRERGTWPTEVIVGHPNVSEESMNFCGETKAVAWILHFRILTKNPGVRFWFHKTLRACFGLTLSCFLIVLRER